jgi:hypothetical protein
MGFCSWWHKLETSTDMAVYFDNRIQSSTTSNTDLLWHSTYALLAVASKNSSDNGGSVNFYLDEVL